jgi:hypothetical protein
MSIPGEFVAGDSPNYFQRRGPTMRDNSSWFKVAVVVIIFSLLFFIGEQIYQDQQREQRSNKIQSTQLCIARTQALWEAQVGDLLTGEVSLDPQDEVGKAILQQLKEYDSQLRAIPAQCAEDSNIHLVPSTTTSIPKKGN